MNWFPVARGRDLRPLKHETFNFDGTSWVLFRSQSGQLGCLENVCPHRGVPLALGQPIGERFQCAYHGWQFRTDGSCAKVPGTSSCAKAPGASSLAVREIDDLIFVSRVLTGEPERPRLPEGWNRMIWREDINASPPAILENALDPFHTHFIHRGLVRSDRKRVEVKAVLRADASRVEIRYSGEDKQSGLISRLFEPARSESYSRLLAPNLGQMEFCDDRGPRLRISALVTSLTKSRSRVFLHFDSRPTFIPYFAMKTVMTPFLRKALNQDRKILEQQPKDFKIGFGPTDIIGPYAYAWQTGPLPDACETREFIFTL